MSASGSRGGSSDPFWPSDPTEEVEEVAQAVSKAIVRAGSFLSDARCSFCVLGAVSDALPSTGRALAERGLRVADIRGAWAVPAAVCVVRCACTKKACGKNVGPRKCMETLIGNAFFIK